jgi:hypothetical protein
MSTYVNRFDKGGECSLHGHATEKTFKDILVAEGFPVREATMAEQMSHCDFIVDKNNKLIRYEVKARKRISRSDTEYQDDLVWIEIQNVRGDLGWLYGVADYVVFERAKDFVVVDRQKLADFVALTCNLRKQAFRPTEALYCRYTRRGRKDLLTLIKNEDIEKLAERIIVK